MRPLTFLVTFGRQHKLLVNTPLFGLSFSVAVGVWFGNGSVAQTVPALVLAWLVFIAGACLAFEKLVPAVTTSMLALSIFFALGTTVVYIHKDDDNTATTTLRLAKEQSFARKEDEYRRQLVSNTAPLMPDNQESNTQKCDTDGLEVVIGSNRYETIIFPFAAISINGEPFITIDKRGGGALSVSFKLYDQNGDILASVEDSSVFVPPLGLAYIDVRKDLHSLEVKDKRGDLRLSMHFNNPAMMTISGVFYDHGIRIVADSNQIMLPDGTTMAGRHTCHALKGGLNLRPIYR